VNLSWTPTILTDTLAWIVSDIQD